MLNKELIKENISKEDIIKILTKFGSALPLPYNRNENVLIFQTICHNLPSDENSYKLYYYDNNKIFKCYSDSCGTFDIFELVQKVYLLQKNKKISFPKSIEIVLNILELKEDFFIENETAKDNLGINIDKYIIKEKKEQKIEKVFCKELENLPIFRIKEWEDEFITFDALKKYNIRFSPRLYKIVIPHYDEDNNLIGIRGRALLEEDIKKGKYMPISFDKKTIYNHPLGHNLYGLNINKDNIKKYKTIILVEGEKSVLQLESYQEENISVAVCGSNITDWQIDKILSLDVEEVIIAFDKDFHEIDTEEYYKCVKKIFKVINNIKNYTKVSIIMDCWDLLGYKNSPTDKGKEIFDKLLERRFFI